MKTLIYQDQHCSSFTRNTLTPLFRDRISHNYGTSFDPATMRENADYFVLRVMVPGLNKKDLKIEIDRRTLVISSNLRPDRVKLSFSRSREVLYSYLLPSNADAEHATAKCKDGLLTIQIPKLKTRSTHTIIPVKGSESASLKTNPVKTTWSQMKQRFNLSEWIRFKNPVGH